MSKGNMNGNTTVSERRDVSPFGDVFPSAEIPQTAVPAEAKGMQPELVWMTPQRAAFLLNRNHPDQRDVHGLCKALITSDICDDRWCVTHQAIAISPGGEVIDGQTRLSAIVESGKAVWVWVFWNVPSAAMVYIDTGRARDTADQAKVLGYRDWTKADVAAGVCVYCGLYGLKGYGVSHSKKIELLVPLMEGIKFSAEVLTGGMKQAKQAAVRAVLTRAWFTQDRDKLRRFGKVLTTNEPSGKHEIAACKLHTFLLCNPGRATLDRLEVYRKTERALHAFLSGNSLEKLYPVNEELFPLPDQLEEEALKLHAVSTARTIRRKG